MTTMKYCWILDAGPILEQFPVESLLHSLGSTECESINSRSSAIICTTSSVISEIKSEFAKILLESRLQNGTIVIMDPDSVSRKQIEKKLKKTGSWWILSPADRDLLALAFSLKTRCTPIIITNDFELQNACTALQITWHEFNRSGAFKPRIRDQITWTFQCTTCKKRYRQLKEQCPRCGGTLKKKVKKSRKIHG